MCFVLHRIEGRVQRGGRAPIFTPLQEREIVNMVLANNAIRLREIQAKIIEDQIIFSERESGLSVHHSSYPEGTSGTNETDVPSAF